MIRSEYDMLLNLRGESFFGNLLQHFYFVTTKKVLFYVLRGLGSKWFIGF